MASTNSGSVNEAFPVRTSYSFSGPTAALSLAENLTAVTTVAASDADGNALTYSIIGGDDASLFAIDPTTGALSFVNAPDFELPTDADHNNVYQVIVSASDGTNSDTQSIAVTVTNANEFPPIINSNGGNHDQ